jgi:Zn-finger nucleic acid-binding protein
MHCPRDHGELTDRQIDSVQVKECEVCKGLFFEKGELDEATLVVEPDLDWVDFDIWKHEDQFKLVPAEIRCPNDDSQMVTTKYGEDGAEIDLCPKCHSIWLDKGEFEKIIHSMEQQVDAMSASAYVKESLTEAKELVTGEDSFSSEWKDLSTVMRLFQYRVLVEHPSLTKALYFFQRTGMGLAGVNPPE